MRHRAAPAPRGDRDTATQPADGLTPASSVLDAALIAAQQKIEHYEIACYGTVHAFAEAMGETEIAKLLEQTLEEERATDEKLNRLAVEDINQKALKAA